MKLFLETKEEPGGCIRPKALLPFTQICNRTGGPFQYLEKEMTEIKRTVREDIRKRCMGQDMERAIKLLRIFLVC